MKAASKPTEIPEERDAPRFALLIRTAKLVGATGEYLCVVRDISASGVRLQLFHPVPSSSLKLELSSGATYAVVKVWEEGENAGFRFVDHVDVRAFMQEPSRHARRPIRLRLRVPVQLHTQGGTRLATLQDLSRYGARVRSTRPFEIDERLELELPGLPPIPATIAWRSGLSCGLTLRRGFTFEDLAQLAVKLQPI